MKVEIKNNISIFTIPKAELDTIDFVTCKEPKQTLEQFYNNQTKKPTIVINGGFFQLSSGKPIMEYIDDGVTKSTEDCWNPYGMGITWDGRLLFGEKNDQNWKDFISCYPPLVVNKKFTTYGYASELNAKTRRSILGYNDLDIIIIAIDNPGATLSEAAQIALEVKCDYAVNLDGGGSTRVLYNGKAYAAAATNRPVDNVIALYTKSIIYRVQLGAFGNKDNANNFCNKIKSLGSSYANAYIRYISPYYKVQVGAFTNKSYAEAMVQDLKNKGYNAFITT